MIRLIRWFWQQTPLSRRGRERWLICQVRLLTMERDAIDQLYQAERETSERIMRQYQIRSGWPIGARLEWDHNAMWAAVQAAPCSMQFMFGGRGVCVVSAVGEKQDLADLMDRCFPVRAEKVEQTA